jgi:hypothetical protein
MDTLVAEKALEPLSSVFVLFERPCSCGVAFLLMRHPLSTGVALRGSLNSSYPSMGCE